MCGGEAQLVADLYAGAVLGVVVLDVDAVCVGEGVPWRWAMRELMRET